MFGLPLSIALAMSAPCAGCSDAAVRVNTREQLLAAIERAQGGETIMLAPGDYGAVAINKRRFDAPLTLASQSADRPANLAGLSIYGSQKIRIVGLSLGRPLKPGEPIYTQLNGVASSQDVAFERVFFHGSLDANPSNDAWGLYVVASSGVTIHDSRFEDLVRAFIFDKSSNIRVTSSRFRHIQSDAGDFAAVDNVLVDGNVYTDFLPAPGDHPEAVQVWTNGQTKGSSNITISNNQLLQGRGAGPQGFFIRDELKRYPHRNIRIVNNLIYTNDQWEGISIEGADGVVIAGNTVLSQMNNDKQVWIRLERVTGALVESNVAVRFVSSPDVQVQLRDNVFLDRKPGFGKRIPNLRAGASARPEDLLLPGVGYRNQHVEPESMGVAR